MTEGTVSKAKLDSQAVNIDREIFTKLAVIGQVRKVDIPSLLKYELALVPLTLFHLNGSMRKTDKSFGLDWIERDHSIAQLHGCSDCSMLVIDFMMILRTVCTDSIDCKTYGDLSIKLLNMVLAENCQIIAVVGDNYGIDDLNKSGERARRESGIAQLAEIRNPSSNTPIPKQKKKLFANPRNKSSIANYIMKVWL